MSRISLPSLLASVLIVLAAMPAMADSCVEYDDVLPRVGFNPDAAVLWLDITSTTSVSARYSTITLMDLSDPETPIVVGDIVLSADVGGLMATDGHAYATLVSGWMFAVDIDPATAPCIVDSLELGGVQTGIALYGDHALALSESGTVSVVDISTPAALQLDASIATQADAEDIAIIGHHAMVTSGNGLSAVDLSDPLSPGPVSTWTEGVPESVNPGTSPRFLDISIDGDKAAIISYQWLHYLIDDIPTPGPDIRLAILDLSDPTAPEYLTWAECEGSLHSVLLAGDLTYTADWDGELSILATDDLSTLHWVSTEFGLGPLVTNGSYIYAGLNAGLAVYETYVDEPVPPLAEFVVDEQHIGGSGLYQLTAWKTRVYDGDDLSYDTGHKIWDLSDPTNPVIRFEEEVTDQTWSYFTTADVEGDLYAYGYQHNIYATYLRICDMSADPPLCRDFPDLWNTGMLVDLQDGIAWTIDYSGNLVATDVSDLSAPVTLSSTPVPTGTFHISEGGAFLIRISDNGLLPIDVSDPTAPRLGVTYALSNFHEHETHDGLVYAGTWDGRLQIVDITDIDAPFMVGEFDAYDNVSGVHLQDDLMLLMHPDAFQLVSVADPSTPTAVSPVIGVTNLDSRVAWDGDLLYINAGPLEVWDLSDPADPQKIGDALADHDGVFLGDGFVVTKGRVYPLQCNDLVSVDDPDNDVPHSIHLIQADPNPFNPRTTVRFNLSRRGPVDLAVHDLRGRRVRTLVKGTWEEGDHLVSWDGLDKNGRSLPSGTYIMYLRSGSASSSLKVTLAR